MKKEKPDILLIVLDTQRADRLSCYGHEKNTTPSLDQLANEGVLFGAAVSCGGWTVPTHASLFTGMYPRVHQMEQMDSVLAVEQQTLAERLAGLGYLTASISHNPLIGVIPNGLSRGFEIVKNYHYLGAGLVTVGLNQANQEGLAKLKNRLRWIVAELLGYSETTGWHKAVPWLFPWWERFLAWRKLSKSAKVTASLAYLIDLLERKGREEDERPIFSFLNLMGVHVPYAPDEWAIKQFLYPILEGAGLAVTEAHIWVQKANRWQVDVTNWLAMEWDEGEELVSREIGLQILDGVYQAEVATQDRFLGEFLAQLKERGRWEKTLICVTADHGDHLGEKERMNHAFGLYRALTDVPLIIHNPLDQEGERGLVRKEAVSTRRIFHTILDWAGVANEEEKQLSLFSTVGEEVIFAQAEPLKWAVDRLEKERPGLINSLGYDRRMDLVVQGNDKLLALGEQLEQFDWVEDKEEKRNIAVRHGERTGKLEEQLVRFEREYRPLGAKIESETGMNEQVMAHLRQLGYLE